MRIFEPGLPRISRGRWGCLEKIRNVNLGGLGIEPVSEQAGKAG